MTNYLIAKGNNFFIYQNNANQFIKNFKNSFQHGGISMEEMIIPIACLRGKK